MTIKGHQTFIFFFVTTSFAVLLLPHNNSTRNTVPHFPSEKIVASISNKTNLSSSNMGLYSYGLEYQNNELHDIQDLLSTVFTRLKSYVLSSTFLVDRFESDAKDIEEVLKQTEMSIKRVLPWNEDLSEKLKFSKYFFETLADSIELLRHFHELGPMEVHLIHFIIDLKVRLLGLFDSHGIPDSLITGYAYKFFLFSDDLRFFRKEFQRVKAVPFGINWVFQKQVLEAEKLLEVLECRI